MKESPLPIIEVKNLSYRYDLRKNTDILSSVTFSVFKGEWLAVVGNNGSGKSTLARLLAGLLTPLEGKVFIDGIELTEKNKWQIRKKIGIVFQNPDNQFIGTTVEDDVAFGLENFNIPYNEMKQRVQEALQMVDMLKYRKTDPANLSGGQKQRVAIAGVLAVKPEVILLDEAFIMLDPKSRDDMLKTLKTLKEKYRLTIISITHDMNEAASSDRMIVLKNGKITATGTPGEVFSQDPELEPPLAEKVRRILHNKGRNVPDHFITEKELISWLQTLNS